MNFIKKTISNWGNYPKTSVNIANAHYTQDVTQALESFPHLIAHGNGRSYGDAGLGPQVLNTTTFNKILDFDPKTGLITCQSGILLSDLLTVCVPHGFFVPVTPGTKFVTLGGAVAADIHGKNHHTDGCLSNFIQEITLVISKTNTITCSQATNPDLFWATCGGMGLTGIMTTITLQLKSIQTSYINQESIKAKNLKEVMNFFNQSQEWTYSVAWIDCLAKGKHLGRSILMRGEHAPLDTLNAYQSHYSLEPHSHQAISIPFFAPCFLLNRYSVRAFNAIYFNKQQQPLRKTTLHYNSFFYPLDSLLHWNRLYGKKGFIQYQCLFPLQQSKQGLHEVLTLLGQEQQGSFLAVLKLFGEANPNQILSFPQKGYTLTLDFKVNSGLKELCQKLDQIVLKYGGRLYLAKDTLMHATMFAQTYPNKERFLEILKQWNCGSFDSLQAERLGLKR
jgi:FAD/FMN-containing dehydrogenase